MYQDEQRTAEGALFTDQYQISMAQAYFRQGLHERRALFDYSFRRYPDYGRHQAGYAVMGGIEDLLDWMETTSVTPEDIGHLASQRSSTGAPLFDGAFLEWFEANGNFRSLTITGLPEGRVAHANVPIVIVEGPLATAQLLETSLLNHLNYATLIATKAARVVDSARGGTVLEFGMRRGPGEGVNAGARAALVGGADFTSNVGMSHVLGFPPKGTHAHSFVQVSMALADGGPAAGELEAFRAYARVYPDDCVLLVDTIDTLRSGVPNAIEVFDGLRTAGHQPGGVRLDSGDLAYLAVQTALLLDAAGFETVPIVLSSNLDELAIWQILSQIEDEAPRYGADSARISARLIYGVGTRLITSQGHSALDGVYKLVAVEDGAGTPVPAIKISDTPEKTPIPGRKRVWRVYDERGLATVDIVSGADERIRPDTALRLHHPFQPGVSRTLDPGHVGRVEELHVSLWEGRRSGPRGEVASARGRRRADLDLLDPGVRRLVNPHVYHVSLTDHVQEVRAALIAEARRTH